MCKQKINKTKMSKQQYEAKSYTNIIMFILCWPSTTGLGAHPEGDIFNILSENIQLSVLSVRQLNSQMCV